MSCPRHPNLASGYDPVVTSSNRPSSERGDVTPSIGFADADRPSGFARRHIGQPPHLLFGCSVLEQGRANLPISEPRGRDRSTICNEHFVHGETLQPGSLMPTELGRPGHCKPTLFAEYACKVAVVSN